MFSMRNKKNYPKIPPLIYSFAVYIYLQTGFGKLGVGLWIMHKTINKGVPGLIPASMLFRMRL